MAYKVLLLLLIYFTSYCSTPTYLETFYGYFRENVRGCEQYKNGSYFNWIEKTDKPTINSANIDTSLIAIFDVIRTENCFHGNKSIKLSDEKSIGFLVDVVFDTMLERNNRCIAADILTNRTTYKSLKKYKDRFVGSVEAFHKLYFDQMQELFALFNLTEKERGKVYIKQYEKCPLPVRARFGDTIAIAEIIKTFEKNNASFKIKMRAVEQLIYSGNTKAIQYCIRNFNKPLIRTVTDGNSVCKDQSIRFTIIDKLSYYFPDEPLLNEEFKKAGSPFGAETEYIRDYLHRFIDWAEKQYGVRPVDPEPEPFLRSFCIQR